MNLTTSSTSMLTRNSVVGWRRCISSIIPKPHASSASILQDPPDGPERPREFYGQRKQMDVRPTKLNLVARLIRNMTIANAVAQMQFSDKKAATYIESVLLETHKKAVKREADPLNLYVAESYVGRGECIKRINYHSRGRNSISRVFKSHYFLTLREGKPPSKKKNIEDSWKYKTRRLVQAGPRTIPNGL